MVHSLWSGCGVATVTLMSANQNLWSWLTWVEFKCGAIVQR